MPFRFTKSTKTTVYFTLTFPIESLKYTQFNDVILPQGGSLDTVHYKYIIIQNNNVKKVLEEIKGKTK